MLALGEGVARERVRGYALMVEAAEAGCPQAFRWAALAYLWGRSVQQSYHLAAQWYLKAGGRGNSQVQLQEMLSSHPLQCTPFGEWRPELTLLVPQKIRRAMRATMLVCNRKQVPRDIALLIACYVCTEGQEWAHLLRKSRRE